MVAGGGKVGTAAAAAVARWRWRRWAAVVPPQLPSQQRHMWAGVSCPPQGLGDGGQQATKGTRRRWPRKGRPSTPVWRPAQSGAAGMSPRRGRGVAVSGGQVWRGSAAPSGAACPERCPQLLQRAVLEELLALRNQRGGSTMPSATRPANRDHRRTKQHCQQDAGSPLLPS